MKWARIVFGAAGLFGIVVLVPLLTSPDAWGGQSVAPYYFGFATLALVWQIAFLVIAVDPRRLEVPSGASAFGSSPQWAWWIFELLSFRPDRRVQRRTGGGDGRGHRGWDHSHVRAQ